jgi:hypothetical protein
MEIAVTLLEAEFAQMNKDVGAALKKLPNVQAYVDQLKGQTAAAERLAAERQAEIDTLKARFPSMFKEQTRDDA